LKTWVNVSYEGGVANGKIKTNNVNTTLAMAKRRQCDAAMDRRKV